jgi:hypothetical protein
MVRKRSIIVRENESKEPGQGDLVQKRSAKMQLKNAAQKRSAKMQLKNAVQIRSANTQFKNICVQSDMVQKRSAKTHV